MSRAYRSVPTPEFARKSAEVEAKFSVSDITALTTKQINALHVGDFVAKEDSTGKHTYTVSYKKDKTGICLTYTDASVVETVSYDYTAGNWVYNSTDVTTVMSNPMTTANDLIIGGSDGAPTRLAKGSEGQVLQVGQNGLEWSTPQSGAGDLYRHSLCVIFEPESNRFSKYYFDIYNDSSTAITTLADVLTALNNAGTDGGTKVIPATGACWSTDKLVPVIAVSRVQSGDYTVGAWTYVETGAYTQIMTPASAFMACTDVVKKIL